jgi:hypothetical protein
MNERPSWSTPLPRPIIIPEVMTLKTLAEVRKLISHIPKEGRQLSTCSTSRLRCKPARPAKTQ